MIQPRFAAWLSSLGMAATEASAIDALRTHGSWTFMAFISRARQRAAKEGILSRQGSVVDQAAFTRICETIALEELDQRRAA